MTFAGQWPDEDSRTSRMRRDSTYHLLCDQDQFTWTRDGEACHLPGAGGRSRLSCAQPVTSPRGRKTGVSPNQKKALTAFVLFLIVDLVAVACGHVVSWLGGDRLESVLAGGGAWAVLMTLGVTLIALFDFKDDRQPPQPPPGAGHGAPQAPPNQPGTTPVA